MNKFLLIGLLSLSVCYAQVMLGVALMVGTDSGSSLNGFVAFVDNGDGTVTMRVNVTGVTPVSQDHGIHIHEFGDLLNVTSVGAHWNPLNQTHGCPPNNTRHLGDTGNWAVAADGSILAEKTLDLLTLTGTGSIIGHAVVIHGMTDDCVTVASSGSRVGFGVIGILNPTTATLPATTTNMAVYGGTSSIAVCHLVPIANSGVTGTVYFQQVDSTSTTVTAMINGLVNGSLHGFHVHEFGDLSDMAAGLSVGGHYNPYNGTHSLPGYGNPHVGDLGNIYYYDSDGTAYYKYTNTNKMIVNGMNNIVGRAVVVHAKEDNCTMPSAAGRIAFCVIGVSNGQYTTVNAPGATTTTQDNAKCALLATTSSTTGMGTTGTTTSGASAVVASFAIVVALVALLF